MKKDEALKSQNVSHEQKIPRYATNAGITIEGFDGEGKISNIGISGCCIQSVTYVSVVPDVVYQAKIIPEAGDRTDPFGIKLLLEWTKSRENLFEAGFKLAPDQNDSKLRQYVERLQSRGVPPDYGDTGQPKTT
jgi:hypothetical protein